MQTEVGQTNRLETFAQRVSPIRVDQNTLIKTEPRFGGVELEWMQTEFDYPSTIFVGFTDSEQAKNTSANDWQKNPKYIVTDMAVGVEARTGIRNPIHSLRAVLTMLATIEQVAQTVRPFTHIVRANELSEPYFAFLTKMGMYHLSDARGMISDTPQMFRDVEILYACDYPTNKLGMLKKYVISDFVDALKDFIQLHSSLIQKGAD